MSEKTATISRYKLTRPNKVMFPGTGISKYDLAEYFSRVADLMLPHLKDRPLTLKRFPDGLEGDSFYQKNAPQNIPEAARTVQLQNRQGGTTTYLICNNRTTLMYLADLACITPHIWLSRREKPDHPDRMVFDLDPSNGEFRAVSDAAQLLRAFLEAIDLKPYVMTTGSRGVHVVVGLKRKQNFDEVRTFARKVADRLAELYPDKLTTEVRKSKRSGRLFLDTARNAYGQTSVVPYAPRAIKNAPVATPLSWKELNKRDMESQKYKMKNVFRRISGKEDPWRVFGKHTFTLNGRSELLEKIKSRSDL